MKLSLTLIVFFACAFCFAQGHKEEKLSYELKESTVSSGSFQSISEGVNRKWLRIENVGNSVVFISTETVKETISKSSVTLNPGEIFSTYDNIEWNAVAERDLSKLSIVEGK